eukprot:CAMPEP_0182483218 /NCGR_PEP_ID=MMETSP1319-20130603/40880_1 /TAXON_ID=172717 /ORGANISM="Bolidomonas pacifica, Strain RCC208" /LENGTH=31 /DNA_ID= /DNA_START= /DNA_END= /DNA_ORIENTATION=
MSAPPPRYYWPQPSLTTSYDSPTPLLPPPSS